MLVADIAEDIFFQIRDACFEFGVAQAAELTFDAGHVLGERKDVCFCRHLLQTIVSALAISGLAAHRLELEITETVLLQDSEATLATL